MKKLPIVRKCQHNNMEIEKEYEFIPYVYKGYLIQRDKPIKGTCLDCGKNISIMVTLSVTGLNYE